MHPNVVAAGNDDLLFADDTALVSDDELGDIRGGFLTSGGMIIDIGLVTQTVVNGVLVSEQSTSLNPDQVTNIQSLQTIATIDANNVVISNLDLNSVSQIVSVVQNSRNNVVVDSITLLNIDVGNVSGFLDQTRTGLIDHQLVNALQ